MTTLASLRYEYATAFEAYLADPSEAALQAAYELGRDAVARELSVLDLAAVHHDAVRAALAAGDAQRVADAAAGFFLESLSAFEMLQRGFREAQEAARAEQRQAAMLRQLSSFLGDASLALNEVESIDEMLVLVAEQARELLDSECCVAHAAVDDDARFEAVCGAWDDVSDRTTLFKLASLLRGHGETVRRPEAELADDPAAVALGGLVGRPLRSLLAAPLTALDGRELGWIQLFDSRSREYTDVHEAQLLHLTQLASAALERVALFGRSRRLADALQRGRHSDETFDVVVRRRTAESGGAVWFDALLQPDGRLALVAGEVRGPAAAVAAAQARAAAAALVASETAPRRVAAELSALLERLAPDNPARAAVAVVGGARAETFVDGVGEAVVDLGDGAALVLHVGGGAPPSIAVASGGAEAAAARALAEDGDAEAAVLAVVRRP
jgi:GAF domain-containing protein